MPHRNVHALLNTQSMLCYSVQERTELNEKVVQQQCKYMQSDLVILRHHISHLLLSF